MHHDTNDAAHCAHGSAPNRLQNDILDGKPPRPHVRSAEVFAAAANNFLAVDGILDVRPEQEERLRRLFKEAACSCGDDPVAMAAEFTRLAGLGPIKGIVALCDRLMEYVYEEQERLQCEWVRDNHIADPILEPRRVVVRRWTGVRHVQEHGIALPGGDAPLLGMFRFFDRGRNNLSDSGEIFSTLVLDLEDILYFEPLAAEDVELLEKSAVATEKRMQRLATASAR